MRVVLALLVVFSSTLGLAQTHIGVTGGGQYLAIDSWDQAVNTYNFNRPWLAEPLPQLSLGWQAGVDYTRKVSPIWQPGAQLRYQSYSVGEDVADALQLKAHLFQAVFTNDFFVFGSNDESALADLYARLGAGYGFTLARTSNANDGDGDDEDASSFTGMSLPIVTALGYQAKLGNRLRAMPMAGLTWYPRIGADGLTRALTGNEGEIDAFGQGYAINLEVRMAWLLGKQE